MASQLIILGTVLSVVGSIVFVWGCVNYALGKGYSPWMGALGLLGCIGLIILVIMPDKVKDGGYGGYSGPGGYAPPQPGVCRRHRGALLCLLHPARKSLGGDDL